MTNKSECCYDIWINANVRRIIKKYANVRT